MWRESRGGKYEARSDFMKAKRGRLGLRGQEWSNSLAERKQSALAALTGNICMENAVYRSQMAAQRKLLISACFEKIFFFFK